MPGCLRRPYIYLRVNDQFSISASYLYGFYEIWITLIYRPYSFPLTMELCWTFKDISKCFLLVSLEWIKESFFLWVSPRNSCKTNLDDKMISFQTSSCMDYIIWTFSEEEINHVVCITNFIIFITKLVRWRAKMYLLQWNSLQ